MTNFRTRGERYRAGTPSGFSLAELVFVLLISGIILAAAAPTFTNLKRSHDLRNAALRLRSDVRLSQRVAASRYIQRVLVIGEPNAGSYTVFDDENRDRIHDDGERLQVVHLPRGLEFTDVNLTPPDSIIFVPAGTLQSPGQGGTLAIETGEGRRRWIRIWSSGTAEVMRGEDTE
jgi:prepilin-type N-terminal cleavage/methylation domain-containing protein